MDHEDEKEAHIETTLVRTWKISPSSDVIPVWVEEVPKRPAKVVFHRQTGGGVFGRMGWYCGYVKVLDLEYASPVSPLDASADYSLFDAVCGKDLKEVGPRPVSITYGVDEVGWLGFDTADHTSIFDGVKYGALGSSPSKHHQNNQFAPWTRWDVEKVLRRLSDLLYERKV